MAQDDDIDDDAEDGGSYCVDASRPTLVCEEVAGRTTVYDSVLQVEKRLEPKK